MGGDDDPPAPTALFAEAVEENKAIKVRWTNNAEGYKTEGGVTSWKKGWHTEIWYNSQPSFTASDADSYNGKFSDEAQLAGARQSSKVLHVCIYHTTDLRRAHLTLKPNC